MRKYQKTFSFAARQAKLLETRLCPIRSWGIRKPI